MSDRHAGAAELVCEFFTDRSLEPRTRDGDAHLPRRYLEPVRRRWAGKLN